MQPLLVLLSLLAALSAGCTYYQVGPGAYGRKFVAFWCAIVEAFEDRGWDVSIQSQNTSGPAWQWRRPGVRLL